MKRPISLVELASVSSLVQSMAMTALRLHTRTTLFVTAILLAMLVATLLLVTLRIVNLVREDEKDLARLLALGVAEQISLLPSPRNIESVTSILTQAHLARPKVIAVRVWKSFSDGRIEKFSGSEDRPGIDEPADRIRQSIDRARRVRPIYAGIGSLEDYTVKIEGDTTSEIHFHVFAPISEQQNFYGMVEIVEDLENIPSIISDYAKTALLLALIAIALMMITINSLFKYLVYRPISELDAAMEEVKEGSLEVEVRISSQDEFGRLAAGFNRMIRRLRDLTKEREAQQEILRDRVRESTAELQAEIVERKRAETESNLAAARYRIIFDSTPLPMWVYDPETLAFLTVNDAAVQTYGWTRDEFLRMTVPDLYTAGDPAVPTNTRDSANRTIHREWRHCRKDGSLIDVELYSHDLIYEGVQALLVIASDITEKKRIEAAMLRSQRLESIGTLASGIAHDLNNILSPLSLSTYLLRSKSTDTSSLETLDTMEEVIERASQLVRQVLSYARGMEGERCPLNPKTVVRETIDILKETLPKSIVLHTHTPPTIPGRLELVNGNPTQLHQVLMNLCVNARDAMPEGGILEIGISEVLLDAAATQLLPDLTPGQFIVISVRDTGSGIDPRIIDHIFDPFFTTKERGQGSGLGLSTSLGIVRSHGGSISVDSRLGHGSTFMVYLPALRDGKEVVDIEEEPEPPGGNGETILLVDDEEPIRRTGRGVLEAFGYRVISAANGEEAIALYRSTQNQIHAIVTDITMPVSDGIAVITEVRRLNQTVPIIVSSGLGETDKVTEALNLGADRFLPKPYTASRLLWMLHEALTDEVEPGKRRSSKYEEHSDS